MKITNIRSAIVHAEMRNWIFVRVETDQDGLFGWGEATLEWKTRAVAGAIEDLDPLVIGRDPCDIEKLVRVMKKHSFWRLGVIGMAPFRESKSRFGTFWASCSQFQYGGCSAGEVRDRVKVYTHLALATCARSMKPSRRSGSWSARTKLSRAAIAR